MIRNIQALRGIAACMVFLIHLLSTRTDIGLDWLRYHYWWIGPAGVDIFFVISGFIVSTTAARAGAHASTGREAAFPFALKRAFRVYPVYWVVLALAFLVAPYVELAPDWVVASFDRGPLRLALLATTENDKVMAAWTLCYEMYFYLVVTAILLFAPKRVFPMLALWTLIEAASIAIAGTLNVEWMRNVVLSPLLLEFALGCGIGCLISQGVARAGWFSLALGLIWFCGGAVVHRLHGNWDPWWRAPTFGVAAAFIVYGLVAVEEAQEFTLPKWLCRLGDPSYSIYIWHQLLLAALALLADELDLFYRMPVVLVLAIWTFIVIGFGFLSYHWIERPALQWLNRRLHGSGTSKMSMPDLGGQR
ncbi:MAG: acyltransferase [Dokdonella sp.]